mgnify:CR=1 FL=1
MAIKKYTIKDLSEGKVALRYNYNYRNYDKKELLRKILKIAFPGNVGMPSGSSEFYFQKPNDPLYWWFSSITPCNIPIQSIDDFEIEDKPVITTLPKNWVVKNDGSQLFKDTVIKYINETINSNCIPYSGENNNHYYGIINDKVYCYIDLPHYPSTLLTLNDFIKLTKYTSPNNKNMSTNPLKIVKVNEQTLRDAYKDANDEQKKIIKENVDAFELTTTEEFIKNVYKGNKVCDGWKKRLKKEYPFLATNDVQIPILQKGLKGIWNGSEGTIIEARTDGNLSGISFYLSGTFDWKIVKDESGTECLVPTLKK